MSCVLDQNCDSKVNTVRKCIIIIFGPTGVGKTAFGELLAEKIGGEIVNADMGQFYTPLTIGTAKPDWRNSHVPQHLFDSINEPRLMSVAAYRDATTTLIHEIWNRNSLPVLIGGSGFYLQSLFFPPTAPSAQKEDNYYGPESERWNLLYSIDPERALRIHHNDMYRINRALDIYYSTGKKPSDHIPHYTPFGSFCFVYLDRDRDDLYQRINQRVDQMLQDGWLQEVERLRGTPWEPFLKKKKLIGYDDILNYLEADKTGQEYEQLVEVIAQKTRNYAKRQVTFGNRLYAQLEKALFETTDSKSACLRFNLTSGNVDLYINQLLGQIRQMQCFEK